MATSTFWMLETIKQVRTDIAPGVSGWARLSDGDESKILRTLIEAAEVTIGVPPELIVNIRLWLIDRMLFERAPAFRDQSLEDWEETGIPTLQADLIAVESSLQGQYDDEQIEEPD